MINSLMAMGLSAVICFVLIPIIKKIAEKLGIYDVPNSRSSHIKPTPLLGGMAIAFSAIISIVLFGNKVDTNDKIILALCLSSISIIGVIDDIKHLSAKLRLVLITFLALIVAYLLVSGYIHHQLLVNGILLRLVYFLLIIFWITGITNAINFVDGLDGLASGLSIISLFGFGAVLYIRNEFDFSLIICMAVLGAVIGFFPYNRHKAQIFMGDAGSMFLGFFLSTLSVILIIKMGNFLGAIVPVCFLFVPIMDFITSIIRRIAYKKSIFKPDKMHFHHLLAKKYNEQKAVLILCSFQSAFIVIGLIIYITKIFIASWIMLITVSLGCHIVLYKYYKTKKGLYVSGVKEKIDFKMNFKSNKY